MNEKKERNGGGSISVKDSLIFKEIIKQTGNW